MRTTCSAVVLSTMVATAALAAEYQFEALGVPAQQRDVAVRCATQNSRGVAIAWGAVESPAKTGVVGARMDSGKIIWLDLAKYGRAHIQMCRGLDGNLYLYCGRPGRFLRYDVNAEELADLGIPAKRCTYWLGSIFADDGWFYVGSYPATHLVRCHTRTGEIQDLGRIADDPKQCYIIHPAISSDGVVYCPVGLHHQELWAYRTDTGTKKQILPDAMTKRQGAPKVWADADGQVYGRCGSATFRCTADGIELGKTAAARKSHAQRTAGGRIAWHIAQQGVLKMADAASGQGIELTTTWRSPGSMIYSVSCEREGKIWGGCGFPSSTFCFDPATGKIENFGRLTGGRIQVYDMLSHPKGLFLASYTGAHIDFFDPSKPKGEGNPRNVTALYRPHMQERPVELVTGPDGMVYTGTVPVKGRLGGALARINPEDFSVKVWRNLVPNQSIVHLAPAPETGELLCATSVRGGSSAKPTEKEAFVFLWDTKQERITWQGQPIPESRYYRSMTRADTGLIYGMTSGEYYAFDPIKRAVVHRGKLPVKYARFPYLSDHPGGPGGLIYGIGDDAIFVIDPRDHSARVVARHESLKRCQGFYVTKAGVVYYGSGDTLMRARPPA